MFIQEVIKRYKEYPVLQDELSQVHTNLRAQVEENQELVKQLATCVAREEKDVTDAKYWDNKFPQSVIFYAAPVRKQVINYVEPHHTTEIRLIAKFIVGLHPDLKADDVPKIVMEYLQENFITKIWKYKLDKGETWNTPEQTLKERVGDCDDWAIVEYFLIRQILSINSLWAENHHRLKMVVGHVHEQGQMYPYAGNHAYLIWLADDGQWYTIESTFHREKAIANYLDMPQKHNPMYGVINFTFNEYASWAQHSIDVSRLDFKKKR